MPDALDRIASALAGALPAVDARTVADALWLAAAAVPQPEPSVDEPEPEPVSRDFTPGWQDVADALWLAESMRRSETAPQQQQENEEPAEQVATSLFERRTVGHGTLGTPVRVPVPQPLPQAAAFARALRPFTVPWRHGTATQLDIDATVDRYAEDRVLVPVFTNAPERWFDAVVVVDTAPTMAVWRDTVDEFTRMLSRTAFFRAVHNWTVTTGDDEPLVHDHLGRSAGAGEAERLARVPNGRRLVLVLSDFAAPGWRRPELWRLVSAWASATPTAIIDPLPVRFWPRSGLDFPAVRARATGAPGPTTTLRFRLPARARVTGDTWLPVPALALTPGAVDRWARTVIRTDPAGCDAVLVPRDGPSAPVVTDRAAPGDAAEAFLRTASAPAARLALLSAPFERISLPLLRLLHANAVPEAEPADLAELLVSGLARIVEPDGPVLAYHDEAREQLLGEVTTHDVWTAHHALTRFIAAHPGVTPTMVAVAHTPEGQVALPAELRPFAAATADTLHLLGAIPAPTAPGPARIWGDVPLRHVDFVGREAELARVRSHLADSGRAVVLPEALRGTTGTGKTTLVTEYVYRHQSEYDLVWWVRAGHEPSLRRSLAELGRQLGLPERENLDVAIDGVQTRLANTDLRWLLVFDDADHPDRLRDYLPYGDGHVIVVSEKTDWAAVMRTVELDGFPRDESVRYLHTRWRGLTTEQADRLADLFGDLPLYLDLARAAHRQENLPFDTYYQQVLRTDPVVFARDRLASDERYLLDLCSQFGSEPIALRMLLDGLVSSELWDNLRLNRAVRGLTRWGLAHRDARNSSIQIHPMVREAVRATLPMSLSANANNLLAIADPGTPELPDTWPRHAEITPHLTASGILEHRQLVVNQVRYLNASGDHRSAIALATSATESWEPDHGPDDPSLLKVLGQLASARRALGEYTEARQLSETVWQRTRDSLGDDHNHTMSAVNDVVADLRIAGRFTEATDLAMGTLDRRRRSTGEALTTVPAAGSLTKCLRLIGRFDRALHLDEEYVEITREAQRESSLHRHFLQCAALDRLGLGNYETGLHLAAQAEDGFTDSRNIAPGRHVKAVLLRKIGRYTDAAAEAETAWRACVDRFGDRDIRTLGALLGVSNTNRVTGRLDDARDQALAAVNGYENLLGQHPFTAAAKVGLALALRVSGHPRDALAAASEAFDQLTAMTGPTHPHTLNAAATVAMCLSDSGDVEEAARVGDRTVQLAIDAGRGDHPDTLVYRLNRALTVMSSGDTEALNLLTRRLGARHPVAVAAHDWLECLETDIDLFEL